MPYTTFCQQKVVSELKIGDKIPNTVIRGIINSPDSTINLEKLYHNRLLIINFWATWCVPCIKEMGALDTLKRKYTNSLNILSICHDKPALVASFLLKHKEIKPADLYITSDDKALTSYFQHKYLPHNVWINSDGVVVAITDNIDLSEKNIKLFMDGQNPKLKVKTDSRSFSFLKPLHVEDSLLSYRSIITKYKSELNSGDVTYEFDWRRFFGWNLDITDYYWLAYTKQLSQNINWNSIELHTNDSIKFFYPKQAKELFNRSKYNNNTNFEEENRTWDRENLYCYELRLPSSVDGETFRDYLFEDLSRFFKIKATIEYREKECEVITLKPNAAFNNVFYSDKSKSFIVKTSSEIKCQNVTISELFTSLNDLYNLNGDLFIDNTGLTKKVSIDLKLPKNSTVTMEVIKAMLERDYGLKFKKKKGKYPILILNDLTI
ncbi:MAG: TlpA family protein disulfide reductase [Bacteroidota bacterium]|nr:TlpA family protein disulfide reductase [Bacteroidota bacterium]